MATGRAATPWLALRPAFFAADLVAAAVTVARQPGYGAAAAAHPGVLGGGAVGLLDCHRRHKARTDPAAFTALRCATRPAACRSSSPSTFGNDAHLQRGRRDSFWEMMLEAFYCGAPFGGRRFTDGVLVPKHADFLDGLSEGDCLDPVDGDEVFTAHRTEVAASAR